MKPKGGSGDTGKTRMSAGRRASKTSAAIEALGAIDEASAAVGLARSLVSDAARRTLLLECQAALHACAAEVAAPVGARTGKFDLAAAAAALKERMREIARTAGRSAGFITPGENPAEAAVNLARTVVRRAERRVFALDTGKKPVLADVAAYLNRLSDLLFDLARTEKGA